jgi:hypothetical protein
MIPPRLTDSGARAPLSTASTRSLLASTSSGITAEALVERVRQRLSRADV